MERKNESYIHEVYRNDSYYMQFNYKCQINLVITNE